MAKLKYANQIELLQKKIELKKDEQVKRGGVTKYKLELTALQAQLKRAHERYEVMEQRISDYSKEQRLTKLNNNLIEKDNEVKKAKEEGKISVKKLEIKRSKALQKRDKVARKMKLTQSRVGKVQDGVIKAWDVTKNFATNLFVPIDQINIETEEVSKTR